MLPFRRNPRRPRVSHNAALRTSKGPHDARLEVFSDNRNLVYNKISCQIEPDLRELFEGLGCRMKRRVGSHVSNGPLSCRDFAEKNKHFLRERRIAVGAAPYSGTRASRQRVGSAYGLEGFTQGLGS